MLQSNRCDNDRSSFVEVVVDKLECRFDEMVHHFRGSPAVDAQEESGDTAERNN
jgi:hypothetical protein